MKHTEESAAEAKQALLSLLQSRFDHNMNRHRDLAWPDIHARFAAKPGKLALLQQMEDTGGEPDVIGYDEQTGEYIFCDCSAESPRGRRSLCYDPEALASRKANQPENSATQMAEELGISLLTEEQYHTLQTLGQFDTKTSSWLKTPSEVRKRGGAIFGDRRYGRVFVYHNGAASYYAARGFRGLLRV